MATITVRRIARLPLQLLFNREYFWYLASLLLAGECVLNFLIINKVACKLLNTEKKIGKEKV